MCDLDGDETCDVFINIWRKARLPHVCVACRDVIAPGSRYMRHFQVFDGDTMTQKVCEGCAVAHEAFAAAHSFVPPPGEIRHTLRDCIDNSSSAADAMQWETLLKPIDIRRDRNRKP